MQIFLNLDGQQEGPYSLEQLQAWVQSGQLAPETPAWYDGLPSWTPVNELVASVEPAPMAEVTEDVEGAGEVFLHIEYQPEYSRGQLLLRMFFGWFYIGLPHGICLVFLRIACGFCILIAWFSILFTGNQPEGLYHFVNRTIQWKMRIIASLMNLVDGFPAFGLGNKGDKVDFMIEQPPTFSRWKCLLRLFAIVYLVVPHGICLWFRMLTSVVLVGITFWVVLFTGKYPRGVHEFNVGTLRWALRVATYLSMMTDKYPPFSGKP